MVVGSDHVGSLPASTSGLHTFGQDAAAGGAALGGLSTVMVGVARAATRASTQLNEGMADVAALIPARGRAPDTRAAA